MNDFLEVKDYFNTMYSFIKQDFKEVLRGFRELDGYSDTVTEKLANMNKEDMYFIFALAREEVA
ncbi:MAG: hypothetical protein FH753_00895 [Firmicutes bacterium]|nr:hypothetical protein [Bacillota bacterium]